MAETTEHERRRAPRPRSHRGRPKTRIGIVTSNKMQKTVVVTVRRRARARASTARSMTLREKYKAHVEDHDYPKKITINEGDRVRIAETRPPRRTSAGGWSKVLEREQTRESRARRPRRHP